MKIGVVGLGTIGLKLTEYLPQKGFDVISYNYRSIEEKKLIVEKNFEKKVKFEKLSYDYLELVLPRITYTSDLDFVSTADIILECSKEDYSIKKKLIAELFGRSSEQAVVSSTTSSLNLAELSHSAYWPRFCGIHFFNPPTKMKLIELAFLPSTTDNTKAKVLGFLSKLDDKRVVELPPIQGYVVNKLLFQYINSAMNLASSENVALSDIDEAMRLGTNAPMGPFELADYVGLDVTYQILQTLYDSTNDISYRPCKTLIEYRDAGKLGRKTGSGFYIYQK